MTFVATVVRVLIASPSDLRDERDRVERTIHRWNALHAAHVGVVLMPVRWETNASAEMGGAAQDLINRQIVDESDVLVGMFWTRLGTPTATNVSGTAEELQRASSMLPSQPRSSSRGSRLIWTPSTTISSPR